MVNMNTIEPNSPPDYLNSAAMDRFGISYIFPWQRLVISNVLEGAGYFGDDPGESGAAGGHNPVEKVAGGKSGEPASICGDIPRRQIAILPTGAGKSLCFMLPGVLIEGITVILFPLLSLMSDQKRRLDEQGIKAELLRGGQSREERTAAWQRLEADTSVGDRPKFLLSNPETLVQPAVLRRLAKLPIDHLVIDEAHTVPMWGRGFRPALTRIPEIIEAAQPKMTSAFTATASDEVLSGIQEILFPDEPAHVIRADPDRPNISYHVIPVLSKRRELRRLLGRTRRTSGVGGVNVAPGPTPSRDDPFETPNPLRVPRPALIFCSSRDGTEQLAETLRRDLDEDDIFFYHAGLERAEKKTIEDWFFSSAEGILCATTAYGMGVDKKNIRTVIHQDLSSSVEAFLQESGRGGRDGAPACSIVLLQLGGSTTGTTERQDQRQQALARAFQDDIRCLRENLLALMGSGCEMCWGCDVCNRSRPTRPYGQMELLAFFRARTYRYTAAQAAELLQGADNVRPNFILRNFCAGYGLLQDWKTEEIEEAISALIAAGHLKKPRRGLWRGMVGIDRRAAVQHRRTAPAAKTKD